MSDRHIRDAAQAMRRHAKRHHDQRERGARRADVTQVDPIVAKIENSDIVLEEDDDIVFTQTVRKYDLRTGIEVGDTLVISPMLHGDWLCHDVVSDSDPYRADYVTRIGGGGSDSDAVARAKIDHILDILESAGIMDPEDFTPPFSTP